MGVTFDESVNWDGWKHTSSQCGSERVAWRPICLRTCLPRQGSSVRVLAFWMRPVREGDGRRGAGQRARVYARL